MSTDKTTEPPPPKYILPVTRATYREIRRLLIAAGQGGLFERQPEGGEMINLFDCAIREQKENSDAAT